MCMMLIITSIKLLFSSADQGSAKPQRIIDVGCGIGGSSRHLARKYGAQVVGITLSPKQAQRASDLTSAAGLSDKVYTEFNMHLHENAWHKTRNKLAHVC